MDIIISNNIDLQHKGKYVIDEFDFGCSWGATRPWLNANGAKVSKSNNFVSRRLTMIPIESHDQVVVELDSAGAVRSIDGSQFRR